MGIIKRAFQSFNGKSWDKHYFETSADQVKYSESDGSETDLQEKVAALNNNLQTKSLTLDLTYGRLKLIKQLGIVHVITLSMIYIPNGIDAHGSLGLGTISDTNFLPSEEAYIALSNMSGGKWYSGTLSIMRDGTVSVVNTSDLNSSIYGKVNGAYTTLS